MNRSLLTLCVAALLVTAGCSGLTNDGAGDAPNDADQLKSDTIAAVEDVDTYRMAMEMNVSANGQSVSITQEGVFDHQEERARLNMTAYGTEGVTYMDGSMMYVKMNGRWQAQNFSDQDPWQAGNGLTQQKNVLEAGDASITGSATVDGVATTVLTVDSDEEELKELLAQQGQSLEGVTIENATYRLYVANETDRPRKVELTMTMSTNGRTVDANVTATFSDYGAPVDVTIPDAATQAE